MAKAALHLSFYDVLLFRGNLDLLPFGKGVARMDDDRVTVFQARYNLNLQTQITARHDLAVVYLPVAVQHADHGCVRPPHQGRAGRRMTAQRAWQ